MDVSGRRRRIEERAYRLWEAEGRRHGNDQTNWLRAESENPVRVTFDSNVWEDIVALDRVKNPDRHGQASRVRAAIECGKIEGYFSEGYTTLEAIKKCDRPDFFTNQTIEPRFIEIVQADGTARPSVIMGPNQSNRPQMPSEFREHLTGAFELGLRILMVPRYHEFQLPAKYFAQETEETTDRTMAALSDIERLGVGRSRLREFGLQLAYKYEFTGVMYNAPPVSLEPSEKTKLSTLIAEWADGDAVAAHIGYDNDLFCTEDRRGRATGASVFQSNNKEWLSESFGIEFVNLKELDHRLAG